MRRHAHIRAMPSVLRKLLNRCAATRGATAPFGLLAGTPLDRLADNYLAIITGGPVFGGTGSAVVLRPGLAVTCAHVVEGLDRLTVLSLQGPAKARVLRRSPRFDLALLALPEGIGHRLAVAAAVPGQPVWAMGTTTCGMAPTACGRIETIQASAWLGEADGPPQSGLMYAAEAGPGYSGGPLVDADGALVGITEGIYTRLFGEAPAAWPRLPRLFAYRASDVAAEMGRMELPQI